MLNEADRSKLWRTLGRLSAREKREVIDRLQGSIVAEGSGSNGNTRTAYDIAKAAGIIGAISEGPADVSTNPRHMEGFGRE